MDYPKSVPSAGLVNGKFVDENPLMGTPGSLIPARWGNSVTDEVLNVIDEAGLNPNEADSTQLIQAIRRLNQAGSENHAQDNGAANIYTVAYLPALSTLVDGMVLRFKAKTANTGASTFSPNDLSAKPIVGLALSALQAGEIVANGMCSVVWSATLDKWVLLSCTGGGTKATTTSVGLARFGTSAEQLAGLLTTVMSNPSGVMALLTAWFPRRAFAVNDYVRIPDVPGGLIVQWGEATSTAATHTVNWPIAFPNAVRQAIAFDQTNGIPVFTISTDPTALSNSSGRFVSSGTFGLYGFFAIGN
ncbi:gp53-like domain-containing protein [Pseudomonas sp. Pdm06]|uniref:gp53-like domain-containing protein n=1 Tax=Pseudomonas sp. Pdm06 TaxID=1790044 RepID=UPI001CE0F4F9|nr:hypothetical protein [Pseudomonas sp. Pdm06]